MILGISLISIGNSTEHTNMITVCIGYGAILMIGGVLAIVIAEF